MKEHSHYVVMSNFFTAPASQRKRKLGSGAAAVVRGRATADSRPPKRVRKDRDDSISGSDSEDGNKQDETSHTISDESSSEEEEDAASRRTKLAQRYLDNTRNEVLAEGFDAKDIDNELLQQRMGQRLKEDTAESKGRLYRWIADDYEYRRCDLITFRNGQGPITGIAASHPFVYTVSKDLRLSKWRVAPSSIGSRSEGGFKSLLEASVKGDRSKKLDVRYVGHVNEIYCVAASSDGRFVVTGGKDKRIVVWNAADLKPLRVFSQHRDAVTSLSFRRGTNQLFSASRDRTIKIWSLDELAYVETLYGHQDEIVDVASLNQEHCVTAGARDRTARYWRVVEESQLVFRGGGAHNSLSKKGHLENGTHIVNVKLFHEGSMDRIIMVDEDTFVTGSDNGSIALWSINKKKAVFTWPVAHGVEDALTPEEFSAEVNPKPELVPDPQARGISALAGVPYGNVFFSGSSDGAIRAWKITEDRRSIESLGDLTAETPGLMPAFTGIVNDLAVVDMGSKGKEDLRVVAGIGREPRLGRWKTVKGRNSAVHIRIARK